MRYFLSQIKILESIIKLKKSQESSKEVKSQVNKSIVKSGKSFKSLKILLQTFQLVLRLEFQN